ncbi:MAG TPA: threonylcarbamoyl-AMP synthase [Bdellovibrionales bacterium]|nr:threonylcarbamoyl-AMP synthase [Pseudobdellovibrionaceae bacterium]HAG91707.1 threonylcarbamoyl-AMP synthase [Bdellovibrionales bacterium]|tara:strand:- start:340 stop:1305 length:966 start_codon:yes stop_codon:yes gene_type:complete
MEKSLDQCAEILKSGGVVGMPTETVYGLAGRIDSESALKKIFQTKKRPFFDPLIVHLSKNMDPNDWVSEWPSIYKTLAKKFWPGPLTLIAPKNEKVSDLITAGLPNVGLRCPNHPLALKLIDQVGSPLAAPSANLFGKTSPTQAKHVIDEFQNQVAVLDGGPCDIGVESTVVFFNSAKNQLEVLRPGFVSCADLEKVCKDFSLPVVISSNSAAPGQLKTHYQPKAPVVLEFTESHELTPAHRFELDQEVSGLIQGTPQWKVLSLGDDPVLAARTLYADLRKYAEGPQSAIWIPLPSKYRSMDAWQMILNRLERAASIQLGR